jgi:tight adherence protein B
MGLPFIAILLIFGISLGNFFYQMAGLFGKDKYIDRIGLYTGQAEIKKEEKPRKQENYRQGLGMLARGIEKAGILNNYKSNLRKKLVKANILMKPEEFISISLILLCTAAFFGAIIFGNFILISAMAVLGWCIPLFVLRRKISKRLKTLNNQLGETLAVMSNSLKAGHSFFQAVDSVAHELKGPVADEFTKLQKEISLGVNTETALENMVDRVGSDDLELMVTAVLIQRQIGGNLAEILDNISETIRQRIRAKGEIRTLTAQGRMSGWIISLLPFFLAIAVFAINPEHMRTMLSSPVGIIMIVLALFMEGMGIMIVRKIINIEV